ncbi:MAG: FAD-dependent oxidoreductase [Phycisphaerales bacterium]
MSTPAREADCLIIGAGVAGLWVRASLAAAGYSTLTLERSAAGHGQSIASQGILHRGLKYQLSPAAAKAAEELATAAKVWEDCFAGRGELDLRGTLVLAEAMHMWAPPGGVGGLFAKVTAGMASLTMSSAAEKLAPARWPECFRAADHSTAVYEVRERCVDVASLLERMLAASTSSIRRDHVVSILQDETGVLAVLASGERVRAGCLIACAGEGNEQVAALAGVSGEPVFQRRPLRMVAMRGAPFVLNGHCIQPMSDKPRLTVTTTRTDGELYWWLGGSLAEDGVTRTEAEQVAAAQVAVRECIPWARCEHSRFSTFAIDRAEGRTAEGKRPDGPVVRDFGRVLLAWPTKLALAPSLAAEVRRRIDLLSISPSGASRGDVQCSVAQSPWLDGGVRWS